jgi:acyl-CoA thioesterase FadM
MPRLILDLPPAFAFSTEVQIYLSHVNTGGHLDNAQLLALVSEARVRFFKWLGLREFDVGDLNIVVADMMAQYKSEGFHGEVMRIAMQPADLNRYGFDLWFHMTEASQGREVARGKSGIVFVSRATGKPAPLPEPLRERFVEVAAGASA